MEIQKKNIIAAYESADEKGKEMLKALFPDVTFNEKDDRPITERIKSFEDAYEELKRRQAEGDKSVTNLIDDWDDFNSEAADPDILAEDESRWYPWHWLYTQEEIDRMEAKEKKERCMMQTTDYVTEYAGFAYAYSHITPSSTDAYIGSRLCLKNSELATYCGRQFIDLWADFKLLSK